MKTKIKKDWFGREKSITELYNDTKLWLSEINFINDEIRFLKDVLKSNYISLIDAGLDKKIKEVVKKLANEKKNGNILKKLIKDHKKTMSKLIETNSVISNKNYIEKHYDLQRDVVIYQRKYKKLKKSIFNIVEMTKRLKVQKKLSTSSNLPI